jgi:hypothetical protein
MVLIVTIVNFAIIIGIIVVVYSLIKRFNKFTNRNMEIDKKLDKILNILNQGSDPNTKNGNKKETTKDGL